MKYSAQSLLDRYLKINPGEAGSLSALQELIDRFGKTSELTNRRNFVGHITASGFIVSRHSRRVLLLRHKIIDKLLPPGGHIDETDADPLEGAAREILEETGISGHLIEYLQIDNDKLIPIDIDTHYIPVNDLKGEKGHYHHDFRYIFICDEEPSVVIDADESIDSQWVSLSELREYASYQRIHDKIQYVLSSEFKPRIFFNRVTGRMNLPTPFDVVAVAHFIPDISNFVAALDSLADRIALIPKPKSVKEEQLSKLREQYSILETNRSQICDDSNLHQFLQEATNPIILMDIGGYFSGCIAELSEKYNIVGVVEDTENGLKRYESLSPPVPVYHVARSKLKDNEDFLVGQSVLFSSDSVLRQVNRLVQYMKCAVLGYGKIGKSIAHHLMLRGTRPAVYDVNPVRRLDAHNRLCDTPARNDLIEKAEVIFSATGNRSMDILDFRRLKPGCFIFSVTSSDDELSLDFLMSEYTMTPVSEHIDKYTSDANFFYLVNKGNAVNFIHDAVLGNFIQVVRGEMLMCIQDILTKSPAAGLYELDENSKKLVAKLWLATFVDEK